MVLYHSASLTMDSEEPATDWSCCLSFEGNATKQATSTTGGWHGSYPIDDGPEYGSSAPFAQHQIEVTYQSNVPWGRFMYGSSLVIQLVQD
jgi:hypothetical protein